MNMNITCNGRTYWVGSEADLCAFIVFASLRGYFTGGAR
jgi:hypothetical protein